MGLLYNFSISLYLLAIRLVSLWDKKAKLWFEGRKDVFSRMEEEIDDGDSIIWFHAASLGEFEQGRPIIERCRKQYPTHKILLTFFSPSGYEIRKNYEGADYIYYLPMDQKGNVIRFLDIVQPEFAVFVKYEFWFNYINQMKLRDIPLYIVSAKFRPDQHFFKPFGAWFRKGLKKVTYFFVQDEQSKDLLNSIGISQVEVSGDTRFDRVAEVIQQDADYPLIAEFSKDAFVIVGGSTWPKDEEYLKALLDQLSFDVKLLIAPHEIHQGHLNAIQSLFGSKCLMYSQANETNIAEAQILVVDAIGYLSKLYRFGRIAYIGGGFGVGIHNTLEAAAYGMPIVFGPAYEKFNEAVALIARGGAFSYSNIDQLLDIINQFKTQDILLERASLLAKGYVHEQTGATEAFFKRIKSKNF